MDPIGALPPVSAPLSRDPAAAVGKPANAQAAAKDFEAFFLSQAFEAMFKGVNLGGPFGGGYVEKTYRSFLLDAYAKDLAEQGGLGIADAVRQDIAAAYAANAAAGTAE